MNWTDLIWIFNIVAFALLYIFAKTKWGKAHAGEWLLTYILRKNLNRQDYTILTNIMLRLPDGSTTQIDHVVVSRNGIFVIEMKNYNGWIYGDERSNTWTQTFSKWNKYKFQNPLRQNYRHVMALATLTEIPVELFNPVVVFSGFSKFKTNMPANVCRPNDAPKYLRSIKEVNISDEQVPEIVEAIEAWQKHAGPISNREHIKNLKTRHGKNNKSTLIEELPEWMQKGNYRIEESEEVASDSTQDRQCPHCKRPLILRISRKGANPGKQFMGCSGWPICRYTEVVT